MRWAGQIRKTHQSEETFSALDDRDAFTSLFVSSRETKSEIQQARQHHSSEPFTLLAQIENFNCGRGKKGGKQLLGKPPKIKQRCRDPQQKASLV